LTVITRKQQQTSARQWDLDNITENPNSGWNLHFLSDEEIKGIDEIGSIIDDLILRISINGDFLEAFSPFNPSNLATRELSEQKIYLHNEQITITLCITSL
jgi:hypothetical protein